MTIVCIICFPHLLLKPDCFNKVYFTTIGIITSSKKITSRGPSFLPHEDKQVCSSWLEKSECLIRCCEKKFLTHWKEVTEHYNSERESADKGANERTGQDDEPVIRTLASLKTR